jgi:two-component system chemotaxis sensor kinase CheA
MSQHDELLQVFHEEADDLLAELEAALLALERGERDSDLLAETFRLLHTLKGTCSMYGFSTAAGLAHEVETVFARVRDGSMVLTGDLVDLALRARDAMAMLVSGRQDQAASAREITQVLMDTMQEAVGARDAADVAVDNLRDAEFAGEERFIIRVTPRGDLFIRGVSLSAIVAELRGLGATAVTVDTGHVPALADIDPEQCYLAIEIDILTERGRRALEDTLMFLDESEFSIESVLAGEDPVSTPVGASIGGARAAMGGRSVRVAAERLDDLVNLVGELVTTQVALRDVVAEIESQRVQDISERLEQLVQGLRESVLDMRMIPIGTTFGRYARYVRDLSRDLGKDVVLVTEGASSELDRGVIERIEEPLLHLIRNSVDHGIESPVDRRVAGKPEQGTITLSAYHSGGSMYIRLADDGRGIDLAAVADRARETGVVDAAEVLTDRDLIDLVFGAGFSTARELTSVSGRGVGLDAVRKAVEQLQGAVDLESRVGEGLAVTIRLPLTLAIIDGLLVSAADETYVLPLSGVEECIEFSQPDGWATHDRELVDVRGEVLPFVRLRDFFGSEGGSPEGEIIALANVDGERFGIVVDEVIDRLQLVIKPLGRGLRRAEGLAGATMLGDGSVAFIVDMGHVRRLAGLRGADTGVAEVVDAARGRP